MDWLKKREPCLIDMNGIRPALPGRPVSVILDLAERDEIVAEIDLLWADASVGWAQVAELRAAIETAMQRLNESGTGEMGVVETIHATHGILRRALEQKADNGTV